MSAATTATFHAKRREWALLESVCGRAELHVPPLFVFGASASDASALIRQFFGVLNATQHCDVYFADAIESASIEVLLMRLAHDHIGRFNALCHRHENDDDNPNHDNDDDVDDICYASFDSQQEHSRGLSMERFLATVATRAKSQYMAGTAYYVIDNANYLREYCSPAAIDYVLRLSELCGGANVTPVLVSSTPYALFPKWSRGTLPYVIKLAPYSRAALQDAIMRSGATHDAALAAFVVGVFAPVVSDVATAVSIASRFCEHNPTQQMRKSLAEQELKRLASTDATQAAPIKDSTASSTSLLAQQLMMAAFFAANTDRSVDDPLWSRTGAQLSRDIKLLDQPAPFTYGRLRHILELMCTQQRSRLSPDDVNESFLDEDLVQTEIGSLVERGTLVRKWRALNDDQLKFRCTLTANDACTVAECLDALEEERVEKRRASANAKRGAHGFVELLKALL
jgi:hypothetical protein